MIKMVVSDMDGTLLRSDMSLSIRNKEAIQKLQEQGIHFTIATGRPEQLMKEYVQELELQEPIIMYNGSVIGHPFQEKRLLDLRLQEQDVKDIVDYCEQHDVIYMLYTQHKLISKNNYRVQQFLTRNESLPNNQHCIFEIIDHKNQISHFEDINKILIIEHDLNKNKQIKAFLHGHDQFTIASSQTAFIDINPQGASKGHALEVLAKHYNIDVSEIAVFGDQDNDVTMLQIAGMSVVMENASQKAKEAATFTTLSNNDDGFAIFVENHILK